MATTLLASLFQIGVFIFTPWLLFPSTTDRLYDTVFGRKRVKTVEGNERLPIDKEEEADDDEPPPIISSSAEQTRTVTRIKEQIVDRCAFVFEICTVSWLLLAIQTRKVVQQISSLFDQKNKKTMEATDAAVPTSLNFGLTETKLLKRYSETSQAVDSLLNHSLPASKLVREAVPDFFLLHFAALTDDASAQQCLKDLGGDYELGRKGALFGRAEKSGWLDMSWEQRVNKCKDGLSFKMDRKYMRDGLYLYRTTAVFEDADVKEFRKFILSPTERLDWDWSAARLDSLQTEKEAGEFPDDNESYFLFSENKMPGPLKNREYLVARRVWNRPDGGCYSVSNSASHPEAPQISGKNVRVDEHATAFVLKPLKSVNGERKNAVELSSLYYDNAKMKPLAYNIAMNKSMWMAIVATDKAFRNYQSRNDPVQDEANESQEDLEMEMIQQVSQPFDPEDTGRVDVMQNLVPFGAGLVSVAVAFGIMKLLNKSKT